MKGYRKKRKINISIEGVVALAEWADTMGDSEIVILTDDDEEFYIDMENSAINPESFLNARVVASGRLYEEDGQSILAVKRMRAAEDSDRAQNPYGEEDGYPPVGSLDRWADDGVIDQYVRPGRGPRDLVD